MLLKEVIGNLQDLDLTGKIVEKIELEWFELDKRLIRRVTDKGTEVGISLDGSYCLGSGDVLYKDDKKVIAIELIPTQAIVLEPQTMKEMAHICYQLGNRHAPIFLEGNQILIPFDPTILEFFNKLSIGTKVEKRRLEHVLQPASRHHH
ncbi:urease accessory protein UreE [Desulfosporosinus sp. SB140]|uniref:urease accessory protein UreE n=1 Tax=Desulfosporosinus paludis TaxID=3115649 RepID=UPI00388E3855